MSGTEQATIGLLVYETGSNADATWWNVANIGGGYLYGPEEYKAGSANAKRRAIELYQQFLSAQKKP
jgi:hypothetical protein